VNSGGKSNAKYHSFCPVCCHPMSACCCGSPQCRKEAKELVVEPGVKSAAENAVPLHQMASSVLTGLGKSHPIYGKGAAAGAVSIGQGSAFIGGGCCVHLSVEYMPENALATDAGAVIVAVTDSENTSMIWGKVVEAKSDYQVKENIIATNPGAKLAVYTINVLARVRWCEVFSC
jgi:hypothetical protein